MGISRRQFLKISTSGGVAVLGVVNWRLANAAEFTYKLGNDQPITHPQTLRMVEAAKEVKEKTNGRVVIQTYPSNQLGGAQQMFAQLRSGALEMVQASDNMLGNVSPASNFANLPFVFDSYQQVWETMDGPLGKTIHNELEKLGLYVFDKGWAGGLRHVFTKSKPVHVAADMKGLKLRVPGAPIQIAFFKALGSSPSPVPVTELYSALQTNLVDGAEQALASIKNAKYFEVAKYVTLTKHQATTYEMMANAAAWQRLPSDLQEIVANTFNQQAVLERDDMAKGDPELQAWLAKQGLEFIEPDRDSFRAVMRESGLYMKWRDQYGPEAFAMLEASVGKLT